MKAFLSKPLFKSAKALVKLVEEEKAAIGLINTLNGIEKEINLEQKLSDRYEDMLHDIIGEFNYHQHAVNITFSVSIEQNYMHNSMYLQILHEETVILLVVERYTEYVRPETVRQNICRNALKLIGINGLKHYIENKIKT